MNTKPNTFPSIESLAERWKKKSKQVSAAPMGKEKKLKAGIRGPDRQGKKIKAGIRGPDEPKNKF